MQIPNDANEKLDSNAHLVSRSELKSALTNVNKGGGRGWGK